MDRQNTTVISLGGSLIMPGEIDVGFLEGLKSLLVNEVNRGRSFFLVTGGGAICRDYQLALSKLRDASNEDLDWMGIHATRYNAQFIRLMFKEVAHPEVILKPESATEVSAPIAVGAAGNTPGTSSDFKTVQIADVVAANQLVNLSNITHVYDKDPDLHEDATPIDTLSWKEYFDIIPEDWDPGLHTPFDPTASRAAKQKEIEVAIMSGDNLDNLQSYLHGNDFVGTVIS